MKHFILSTVIVHILALNAYPSCRAPKTIIKKKFPISQSIINQNRMVLAKIPEWFDESTYQESIFMYGLPPHVKDLINKDVGSEPTYSDLLCYLSTTFSKKPVYLELGVSFGKNFFQLINFLKNTTLIGFDFEEINPILEKFFCNHNKIAEWPTVTNSMKKTQSSLHKYMYQPSANTIFYLNGDVLDESSWKQLAGKKINLIFSDAFHTPEAILREYMMIEKYDLLDNECIMVWDDLNDDMIWAFNMIFERMQKKFGLSSSARTIIQIRGWLGIHEALHNVGVITKLPHLFLLK